MTLRQALQRGNLSYRPFAKRLNISPTSISRLVLHGEYPTRLGQDEVKRRMSEVFAQSGIDPRKIDWPEPGMRPGCSGFWRAMKEERGKFPLPIEEVDLMQLDRNVLSLFGLKINPFLNDVETEDDVFRHRGYELVETAIRDAVEQRGFLAVVAESGAGKTTIWDGIEAEYGNREDTIICRPQVKTRESLTPEHLARCLIYGLLGDDVVLKNNAEDRGRQLSVALRGIRSGPNDRRVVLLIDDAHFCNASVLRQLKTFYEEKIGRYRLLTIILVGLPHLKQKLAEFAEIGNRIRLVELPPVPVKEYLEFKLRRVGSSIERLFDKDGFEAFCERFRQPRKQAMGRPLLINAACIRAMVMLHQNGAASGEKITRELIDQMPGATTARRVA